MTASGPRDAMNRLRADRDEQPSVATAKVALVDPAGAVLLLRGHDPTVVDSASWWFLPGGRLEPGESVEDAARREVWEETGLELADVGPVVRRRPLELDFMGEHLRLDEHIFLARVERFEVRTGGWTDVERAALFETRWWPLSLLATTTDTVYPEDLAEIVSTELEQRP